MASNVIQVNQQHAAYMTRLFNAELENRQTRDIRPHIHKMHWRI